MKGALVVFLLLSLHSLNQHPMVGARTRTFGYRFDEMEEVELAYS